MRTGRNVAAHRPVEHGGMHSACGPDPRILDFSSNVSPAGMPASVIPAVKKRLDLMGRYPDPHSASLVSGLKRYTGLPERNIVVGNGAVEIIYNFCSALLTKGRVLIPAPTFGEYEAASGLAGCRTDFFKTMCLARDIGAFISRIPAGGCVFVCNPNNPTGEALSKRQVSRIIAAAASRSSLVFVDECFVEMVEPVRSVLGMVRNSGNLLVLRSLTKSFGLAGIRVGYAGASRQIADVLNRTRIPWSVNALAQEAGLAAIRDGRHLARSRSIIKKELRFLREKIDGIDGLECYDSSANFVLIGTRQDSARLRKKLLGHGILVRDCGNFRGLGSGHIRVAIRSHRDNLKLVRALEAAA